MPAQHPLLISALIHDPSSPSAQCAGCGIASRPVGGWTCRTCGARPRGRAYVASSSNSRGTALVAVVSAVVLRGPLGPLAQTTVRSGLSAAWLSGLLLWAVGTLAVVGAAMSVDSRLVEPSLRSSVGCAALAVLGAIAAGPNLATALVLGWLMLTALLSAQANAAWWMWNLPVTGGATTACAVCVVAVAGLAVGWWWIRNPVPALHGRR